MLFTLLSSMIDVSELGGDSLPELKSNSPILSGLLTGQCFTEHDGVRCYPAIRMETGEKYIIKVVSVPASAVQTAALLLTGAISSRQDAKQYYSTLAQEVLEETRLLNELALLEGFVGCDDVLLEENDSGDGYNILIRSPYRESLETLLTRDSLTHLAAINLGLDLCAALATCRRKGYLFVDLKPDNVFLTDGGAYCIGDIGFTHLRGLKYASLPQKYRSSYTAPEMSDCFTQLNDTLDVYALGLILYRTYNGGILPFEGDAPNEQLPPPMYADYELSEIILKACAPDICQRFADPAQFGQALTAYMRRNSVNATPIVPPPQEEQEEASKADEESTKEEFLPDMTDEELRSALEEESKLQDEAHDELTMIAALATDTAAAEIVEMTQDEASDEETAQMLAQAAELMTLVVPEPVVAPEALEISLPEQESPNEESPELSTAEEYTETESAEEACHTDFVSLRQSRPRKKKEHHYGKLIAVMLVLILLGSAAFGSYYYYNDIYLQYIDGIQITGTDDTVEVTLITDIDLELLRLNCTDSYGNAHPGEIMDGKVVFRNLKPQTRYTVSVSLPGFHELRGDTIAHFTTASRTEILSLQATVGPSDGSVILSFTTAGPAPDRWQVIGTAPDQETITQTFSGSSVTVTGLNVGTEYAFSLVPEAELYLAGQTQITFTAVNVVLAQDPIIDSCHDGLLHVTWKVPENESVEFWTVRCYNAAGYDVSITTTQTEYTFVNVDHSAATTVEIIAAGMTKSVTTIVGPYPITVWDFKDVAMDANTIHLSWNFTDHAPEGGWIVNWSVDGIKQQPIDSLTSAVEIPLFVPGGVYEFSLQAADATQIFGGYYTIKLPEGDDFYGFGIGKSDLQHVTFRAPDRESWTWKDVDESCITNQFTLKETGYILFNTDLTVAESSSFVRVNYLLRGSDGSFVLSVSELHSWNSLWDKGHMVLALPAPVLAGNYVLSIYVDGMHLCDIPYTIA